MHKASFNKQVFSIFSDEVLTQLTPHLKALQQNWDEVINQMAVQSDCNKPTKIAIKFLNHIKNDEYMKDSLLSVRLLHTAMSIHVSYLWYAMVNVVSKVTIR